MSSRRGTIFLEDAEILEHAAHPGRQYVLRLRAPRAARAAAPGSFAHLACDASVPMRRPLSIMRAEPESGWLEFLYKPVGAGLAKLARRAVGDRLSLLAPIGTGFRLDASRPNVLALGGGVGIPPMVFLAQSLRGSTVHRLKVLMGSEVPFPFALAPPAGDAATATLELLDEWGIPSKLASNAALPHTYRGHVTELGRRELERRGPTVATDTQLVACGPEPMLHAAARLAEAFDVPCQLALEEYMACGVGGCAGCTVRLVTPGGPAMRRVCVDGPVFDSREVYPPAA